MRVCVTRIYVRDMCMEFINGLGASVRVDLVNSLF